MGPATEPQRTKLALLFVDHGVTDRGDRLRLCSDHAGRLLRTSADLSRSEAHELINRLDRLPRDGGVRAAADRLAAAVLAANRDPMDTAVGTLAAAGMLAEPSPPTVTLSSATTPGGTQ